MSGQHDQTTANKPAEPVLCKMGCGFFGNGATGGCCSKCWRDLQKASDNNTTDAGARSHCVAAQPSSTLTTPQPSSSRAVTTTTTTTATPEPMDVVMTEEAPRPTVTTTATTPSKKKKTSYKNVMASMMKHTGERDQEKEKEALRKVVGGGAFSKIDKI